MLPMTGAMTSHNIQKMEVRASPAESQAKRLFSENDDAEVQPQ